MSDKIIAGVDFSGASKAPNDTWMAIGHLSGWQFQIIEIHKVGSHRLSIELNEREFGAVGIDCPFSLPIEFIDFLAQRIPSKDFDSWQALAEHLVFLSFDDFMAAVTEFKKEPKRITDKSVGAPAVSPLHRGNPSMVQMTYHGIRMLAMLDPQKFAVLPFQDTAPRKCNLLEVYPRALLHVLELPETGYKSNAKTDDASLKVRRQILAGLVNLRDRKQISMKDLIRLSLTKTVESQVLSSDHALDAAIACYTTALYVTAPQLFGDPYASDNEDVLIEGWIYSLKK